MMGRRLAAFPQYWKFAVAALSPVFLAIQAAVTDDRITTQEGIGIAAALAVAGGVLAKGNADKQPAAAPVEDRPALGDDPAQP
jgi:hypothetical protein